MKNYLIFLLVSMSVACQVCNKTSSNYPIIEANAILYNNNLAVDGCAEHISLVDKKGDEIKILLPTEATKPFFTNLMNAEIAKLPKDKYSGNLRFSVLLKYKETQQKGELVCGWNKKSMVEQIEIISISKK